jgi:hypothetical protein
VEFGSVSQKAPTEKVERFDRIEDPTGGGQLMALLRSRASEYGSELTPAPGPIEFPRARSLAVQAQLGGDRY